MKRKRIAFAAALILLLVAEVFIGMFAAGWVRNYLGDVLVVILLYALVRTISPEKPGKWYSVEPPLNERKR